MIRLKPKKKIPKSEAYWQTLAVLQKARLAAKKKVDGRFGSLFGIKVEKYPPQKKIHILRKIHIRLKHTLVKGYHIVPIKGAMFVAKCSPMD